MSDLKRQRILAGYGFEEAAELIGIGVSTLWRYENGKTKRRDHDVIQKMQELYRKPKDAPDGPPAA